MPPKNTYKANRTTVAWADMEEDELTPSERDRIQRDNDTPYSLFPRPSSSPVAPTKSSQP